MALACLFVVALAAEAPKEFPPRMLGWYGRKGAVRAERAAPAAAYASYYVKRPAESYAYPGGAYGGAAE